MRLVDASLDDLTEALRPLVRQELEAVLRERMGEPAKYVTMGQAADMFAVPRHVIRDAVLRGGLTGLKIGRQYRFRVSDLVQWAEQAARAG